MPVRPGSRPRARRVSGMFLAFAALVVFFVTVSVVRFVHMEPYGTGTGWFGGGDGGGVGGGGHRRAAPAVSSEAAAVAASAGGVSDDAQGSDNAAVQLTAVGDAAVAAEEVVVMMDDAEKRVDAAVRAAINKVLAQWTKEIEPDWVSGDLKYFKAAQGEDCKKACKAKGGSCPVPLLP